MLDIPLAAWIDGRLAFRTAPHPLIHAPRVDATALVARSYRTARDLVLEAGGLITWGQRGKLWRDAAHAVGISLGVITYGKGEE